MHEGARFLKALYVMIKFYTWCDNESEASEDLTKYRRNVFMFPRKGNETSSTERSGRAVTFLFGKTEGHRVKNCNDSILKI